MRIRAPVMYVNFDFAVAALQGASKEKSAAKMRRWAFSCSFFVDTKMTAGYVTGYGSDRATCCAPYVFPSVRLWLSSIFCCMVGVVGPSLGGAAQVVVGCSVHPNHFARPSKASLFFFARNLR